MVNENGQLYTIEGVAVGLILLLTAYFVVNSTSIYTPGDTHISDMQLEVIGADALTMMDTAPNATGKSPLTQIIESGNADGFTSMFLSTANATTGERQDTIQFQANLTYVRSDDSINSTLFARSTHPFTGTEHAVHVSRWVILEKNLPGTTGDRHAALVEVLLWRD